ncbi:unnamed protein product [Rotaria sp. Silwood2]|nr:unnamed protein product [Rotaria sp. Silwood2]
MTRRDDDVFSLKFNVDITSEDFTIVWLDANVHRYTQEYNELYRTSNIIELFENEEDCHQFLDTTSNIRSKKLFVIVSGSLGKTFVPKIHEYKQILFIYIFCQQRKQHSTWARNYKKIGDNRIITQTQNLFDQLTDDIRHTLDAMIPINIFNREKEESIQDLDKDSASAMWFQLAIDVLINMEKTSNAKEEMIHLCDSLYSDNPRVHEQIVDFKQNYCHENAIVWYTKDSFLYRLLNKALRIKNIDVIYPFRFFIADLQRQIHQLHTEFLEFVCTDILTVYRGQQLEVDEIRKLELNIGGLVSINTFLSATLNPKVALTYAGEIKDKSVVFKIQIDIRTNTKVPFGSISHMSEHRFEEEFLFSIGAVFRIMAVDQIDNVYYITLKISDHENEEIKHLFSYYYTNYKVNEPTTLITLGMFLHEMGQFDQAAYYYRLMLRNINLSCDYDMQIKLYKQLGYVAKSQGHYQQAIEDYNRALTLILEYNPTNYQDLFEIYNNLGVAYRYVFNFDAALIFMQKTLDLHTNYMELNDSKLSQVFNNLGQVYRSRKEYDNAEFYFKQALHIFNH